MKTYVIGHKKPDLDAVVASIGFAKLANLLGDSSATPVIVDEINEETSYIFQKFSAVKPEVITAENISPEDKVILVDHNEIDQRLDNLDQNLITRIYDHHKVNLNLTNPIEIQTYPVGSSSTICAILFKQHNLEIDKQLAQLLLSAVLSDTVGLKSSTTTESDRQIVQYLANITGTANIEDLTLEIFKAKSDISKLTDEQIVLNDYKIFDFSGQKVLIGQTETVEQDNLLSGRKSNLLDALQNIKDKEGVSLIFLAITDILKVNTKIILVGDSEKNVAEKAFGVTAMDQIIDIGPKMSRKKDIAPAIELALK